VKKESETAGGWRLGGEDEEESQKDRNAKEANEDKAKKR